jgi:CubicO group peptidase (beta-lactamase class C family)
VERVCGPLGLADTRVNATDGMISRLAPGHDADGNPVRLWRPPPPFEGVEGLYSTAGDLMKFVNANLGSGTPSGDNGLYGALQENVGRSPVYLDEHTLPRGWHWGNFVWQIGGMRGHSAMVGLDPVRDVGLVVLADTGVDPQLFGETTMGLMRRAIGEPAEPPRVPVAKQVDPRSFDDYVGRYALGNERVLTVTREGDRLSVEGGPDMSRTRLYPLSKSEFFVKIAAVRFTFERGPGGKVTRLLMHGPEMTSAADRLPE